MTTKFNVAVVERSCAEKYMKALKITDEITPDIAVKDGRVFQSSNIMETQCNCLGLRSSSSKSGDAFCARSWDLH